MTLRTRLFLAVGVIALVSVGLAFGIGAVLTRRAVERNTLKDVAAQAELLAERQRDSVRPPCALLGNVQRFLDRQRERLACVRLDAPSPYLSAAERRRVLSGRAVDGTIVVDGDPLFRSARLVENGRAFVLLRPTASIASSWRPHLHGLLVGALAAMALAALAAWALARAISRPVRRVAAASRRVVADEHPPVVPVAGPLELASLARSFNEMADQLARARAAEREFLLSVSHELKTPLTAIRGYAEALADGAVGGEEAAATISREAQRLGRLVGDLLDLARLQKSRFSFRREEVDLGAVVEEAVARYRAEARSFAVGLEAAAAGGAVALGDADRILQAVSNLIENALRLTPPGGIVRVDAAAGVVAVADTGPGLAAEDVPRAFERFYLQSRYGAERPVGTGLGLAIVKELADGMGGSVEVVSEPGSWTRFVIRLPEPSPAAARDREPTGLRA